MFYSRFNQPFANHSLGPIAFAGLSEQFLLSDLTLTYEAFDLATATA